MNREEMLERLTSREEPWDLIVIGGGATGLGIAVDAASRGYDALLVERSDFAKGTSSRSTKLVHGGVRYLEQGNVTLVMEALRERTLLRANAPHLVTDLPFVVPSYQWWESPFYGIGLKVYDALSGKNSFGRSKYLTTEEIRALIPTVEDEGLRGGIRYHDGQFDDARLALNLAQTAAEQGATVVNYLEVTGLEHGTDGFVSGVALRDAESGAACRATARVVVNATGPFADEVRRLEDPGAEAMIAPSQGVHIVLGREFLPGDAAIMVPHTDDGRVLFAIPWYDVVVVGTTDTALDEVPVEPVPTADEVEFILRNAGRYLDHPPELADVKSVFAGVRPLVRGGEGKATAALSRDHTILVSNSGLMTVAGGKWTTYRKMAEDAVDHAAVLGELEPRACVTKQLAIHGSHRNAEKYGADAHYGSDAPRLRNLARAEPALAERVSPALPLTGAQVVWAAREEMARSVEDVLARRSRCLLFDARAAIQAAPDVGALLERELAGAAGWPGPRVDAFAELARGYVPG